MATSLAQQLQRLTIPQASILKRDKTRPSLLFSPKEAATLTRETIYQIGLEGLEELIQRNEVFAQFENTLFHITSKDFERSLHNTEMNEKLDKSLKNFLILLSPYFMLNCTHKALEWLINRFYLHEYNRDDLLMLGIPYHESNIFVRVIQLLQFKDTRDTFYFLEQLQKSGSQLPKQSLLNYSFSNCGFLKCVCKYIKDLLKYHEKPELLSVAFNFYCTVFTGALVYSDTTEDQVSQMLPLILKGLNSPIADFCAASFVITARLASKISLSDKLLQNIVEKISEVSVPTLKIEATLVLLIIYQSQKQYKTIPSSAVVNLMEANWLPKVLHNLHGSDSYIYPFLEILISTLAHEGINNDMELARNMIKTILDYIKVKEDFVTTILSCILDTVHPKMNISSGAKEWLAEIIQSIEKQYPTQFDKDVYKILSTSLDKKSTRRRKCLSKILKNTITYKGKFDVFEKLYHPNLSISDEALKFLLDEYDCLRETDKEIINNSFIDRLKDDNVIVVKNTLKIIKITGKVDKELLKAYFIGLTDKYQKDKLKWNPILNNLIHTITSLYSADDLEILLAMFPFLLPSSSKDLTKVKKMLNTAFVTNNDLFKPFLHKLRSANDEKSYIKFVLKVLAENTDFENVKSLIAVVKNIPTESWDTFKKYVSFLLLTNMLPKNSNLETVNEISNVLLTFYSQSDVKYDKESTISVYIEQALLGKFPIYGFIKCLDTLTDKIMKPQFDLTLRDYSLDNCENKFFTSIIHILLDSNDNYLKIFLKKYLQNVNEEVQFLLNLCISENSVTDSSFKNKVLNYIKTSLINSEEAKSLIFIDKSIPAFLLVLLSDSDSKIRQLVLDIINFIIDKSTRKGNSYYYLLNHFIKNKEEIIIDYEQVPLIMFNILDPSNTKGKKNTTDLKSIRNNLLKLCCNKESPVYLKAGIFRGLSLVNDFDILEEVSNTALDILEQSSDNIKSFNAKIIGYVVSKVDSKVINKVNLDTKAFKLIETFIRNDKTSIWNDEDFRISPSLLMLNQLHREVSSISENEYVSKLLDTIVEISTITEDSEVLPAASKIFKHIDLDAEWIRTQLILMRDVNSPKMDENKRKRRIIVVPTIDILDTLQWRKGVTVLEFIQDKKKIRNTESILPVLFDILKRCLDFDEQSVVEYPKQLLLSLILHCCMKLEEAVPEKVFNVEAIVQCIRASQNPQTHHHALLVLAHTAHLIPSQVLHHMMAIFTFMGSSVLRHDDAYSFQIISKIVDTIIPIIVNSDKEENQTRNISKVLRVFVDVLLDVPEHRRMPLYKQLLEKIGVKEHLNIFLLLIFEAQVVHGGQDKLRKGNHQKRLEVAADLCKEFSPEIILYNCINLIKYLSTLPNEKEDVTMDDSDTDPLNIGSLTPKDFRYYKYLLVKYVVGLLSSPKFVNQVAALTEENELNLEPLFKQLIVTTLQYIQRISEVSEKASSTPQAQYWKVLLHLSYDILDSVNALITSQMFLLVTKGLMMHKLTTVRRRILELLNNKLQYNQQFFEDSDKSDLFSLIPQIVTIIEGIQNEVDIEQEIIIQTALLSLKLLIKCLAWKQPEKFVQILEFMTEILTSGKAQDNVLASVVLCIAELCMNLRGHAIASLPDFMPALIKILKKQKHQETPTVLLRSLVTTIEKVLDSMPLFLSPYLQKLLVEISQLISRWNVSEERKDQLYIAKLSNIKQKIGSTVPIRILLPAIENCYTILIDKHFFDATSSLIDILAESISNTTGADINSNLNELTNFFLNILKFRTESTCHLEKINIVENHIIEAFTTLTLKLSENTFRPLYYKLYDWAVRNDVKSERLITFYNLSSKIAQSLKGLFVLFAGMFISNAVQVLDACNKVKTEELYFDNEEKNVILLKYTLTTLNAVFLHDNQKFVTRDRFEMLMQPLVDQLENPLGDLDQLLIRNVQLITPCLVHISVAAADDSLWKQMNYQILLKMRHNSSKIRLATLHCITELVKKLGEDFLPLLPETIPFLAELLEDEEEHVEKASQAAIQEMEKVLGEPLQTYF